MVKSHAKRMANKHGFALATVIVVSCVIVIFATAIIGIAASSTQKTSGNLDERQAYLNAKSALDYGANYYGGGSLPTVNSGEDTGEEYILMKDKVGGTTEEGAEVAEVSTDTSDYKTYVHTTYNKKESTITLRAYAKSEDMLGGNSKSTTLSVTYKVGRTGSAMGRQLPTSIMTQTRRRASDAVTIHVRRDPNATGRDYFVPAIYTWSYYQLDGVSYKAFDQKNISVDNMNKTESESNKFEPAGKWVTNSSLNGPVTRMTQDTLGNDWFQHSFSPSKAAEDNRSGSKMVPWFSMIVSHQSSELNIGNKEDGTQSSEFLSVWYLDENDKNIYVEVKKSPFYYYKNRNWNGTDLLKDRLIAYANAAQTVYYVKVKGNTTNSVNPSISVAGHNGSMAYSGYGWWSYRAEGVTASDTPSVTISGTGIATQTINAVSSGSSNSINGCSAYIVIDPTTSTVKACITEEAAAIALEDEDYVTVYAKSFNSDNKHNPKISYLVETHGDSKAKQRLLAAITDADKLYESDYDSTSWGEFIKVVNAAKVVYNKPTLQTNEIYNTQTKNIQDAKANLKYSTPDLTKLQQAITKADSQDSSKYTYESYTEMTIVRNQAQKLVDQANEANIAVRQNTIDTKTSELNDKISKLELIEPYRTQLDQKLQEAYAVQNTGSSSPYIGKLNEEVAAAEKLKNSSKKTEIQKAIQRLTDAISRITSTADTTELKAKIAAAQSLISSDSKVLVSGTLANLQNVVDAANNALNTTTMIQSEVDAYVTAIEDAISKLVYIPADPKGDVESGKKRIWFDTSELGAGNFYVYAWYDDGGPGKRNITWCDPSGWAQNPQIKLNQDTSVSSYYYYDLDSKYQKIIIIKSTNGGIAQTLDISLGKNNFFKLHSATEVHDNMNKHKFTSGTLTTVYSQKLSPWNSSSHYGTVTTNNVKTDIKFTAGDKNGYYYIQRVVFENSSNYYVHKELSAGESASGNNRTENISLSSKPIVVLYPDLEPPESSNVSVKSDTLENILKLKPVTNVKKTKNASISNASYSNNSASVTKTATNSGTYVDSHVPAEPVITVYFLKPSGWSDNIKAEVYQSDSNVNSAIGAKQTNKTMLTDDGSYYYLTVDSSVANTILISDGNKSSNRTSAVKFAVDSSTSKYYPTQLITLSGGKTQATVFTSPEAVIADEDVTFPNGQKELTMAYVGGKKRIFENVADTRGGRKDMCGADLNGGAKFSNTNDWGYARVGFSKTLEYFDWYEYKIPAGETDLYTIQINGLCNDGSNNNVSTKQIHQVWGNIWVSLSSNSKEDGKLSNIAVATVSPEDNVTQEKTRIYISQPTWAADNDGLKVTMWGIKSKTVTLSDVYDGRYYVDVPQDMPFLQISSVNGLIKLPKTKLQGGDKILYEYNGGIGGNPGWVTYVPANVALQRELANAESVANGWALYEYDLSTHAAITADAKLPYKLMNMALSTNPENQSTNPGADQARANELAKWTLAYQNLYNAIINARAYLTMDDNGNAKWYPENEGLATGASYAVDDIKALYTLTKNAIAEYSSTSATLANLIDYADKLEAERNEMKPDVTNKAIFLLDDVAGWSGNIKIRWTDDGGNLREANVTSKNVDGDPLIYVDCPTTITNISFGYGSGSSVVWGSAKDQVSSDQEWVYCNSPLIEKAGWSRNSPDNYFSYSSKSYTQKSVGEEKLVGEKATAKDFILYFDNNVKVTYKKSAGSSDQSYTIPAGAYYVNLDDYQSFYSGAATPPTNINLFSETAESYFTNPANQGMIDGAEYSDTIGWTSSGNIVSHANRLVYSGDVNFVADSGKLNGIYQTNGVISFRWNSESVLNVEDNTKLIATNVRIASVGDISGGSTIAPEFIIKSKGNGEKTTVSFRTNTTIKYVDSTGKQIEFDISQGTYETINADTDINIFDQDFWNSEMKMIGTSTTEGSGSGFLSDPVYSVD